MYCCKCGRELEEEARYCSACGTPKASAGQETGESPEPRPLRRVREGRKIAGVCGGLARYLDIDVTLVRVVWILVTIFPPIPGLVAYLVCWIAMPQDPPYSPASSTAGATSRVVADA